MPSNPPNIGFPEFHAPQDPCNSALHRSTAPDAASASHRILIVRTGANGDILMGTPLLTALRAAWPDAHLTWMVEDSFEREAIDANPYIDEILVWNSRYWKRMTRGAKYPLWIFRLFQLRKMMSARRFDIFISFQPEDWPALTRIFRSVERIGVFDTFHEYHGRIRPKRRRLFSTVYTYDQHPPHRVEQYLLPLQALGLPPPDDKRLVIGWTEADRRAADDFIANELDNAPFVIIAPMTGWPSRIWPLDRWATVADAIAERLGRRIVIVSSGSEKERASVARVAAAMTTEPVLACGTFGVRALAALIERADLVLSGDTGPMHAASATRTPYIALFGPSPVERFAPLVGEGVALSHSVPCGPCHQLVCRNFGTEEQVCLKKITVEEVVQTAEHLLCGAPRRSRLRALPVLSEAEPGVLRGERSHQRAAS